MGFWKFLKRGSKDSPDDLLKIPGLLRQSLCIPDSEKETAIFIGIFDKKHFSDFAAFATFTGAVSSLTQKWYRTGDLESALEWYVPESQITPWTDTGRPSRRGQLRQWVESLEPDGQFQLSRIPAELDGLFYHYGDAEEFGAVGEFKDGFFDAFSADYL